MSTTAWFDINLDGSPSPILTADRIVAAPVRSSTITSRPDGVEPLVEQVCRVRGIAEPEFAPVERFKPRTLAMVALLVVAITVLLPQLADLPRMIEAVRDADPLLVGAAALASLVTYLGSGLAIVGSLPSPVRILDAVLAAIAATFAGSVAPPGVAHVGLSVRLAQRQGLATPVAVSATAAKEVAVGSVHIAMLIAMAITAGSSGVLAQELHRLPSWRTLGVALAVQLAALVGVAAVPRVRRLFVDTVGPSIRLSVGAIRELLASPAKMLILFSGGFLLQLGYVAALDCSVRALGGDVPFVTIGLIYLTVGSAAAVAPTPGGVGVVEAVLLAALTGLGMAAPPALAVVFLYRLVTFWLPIPAGALAMRSLLSRGLV